MGVPILVRWVVLETALLATLWTGEEFIIQVQTGHYRAVSIGLINAVEGARGQHIGRHRHEILECQS